MDPLSITASIIAIVTSIKATFTTVKTIKGLPEAFDKVQNDLPPILQILESAREKFDQTAIEHDDAVKITLESCETKAADLRRIFKELEAECRNHENTRDWMKLRATYYKALRGLKASRVEDLTQDILEDVVKLASNQVFKLATEQYIQGLKDAISDLKSVEPSLPDSDFLTEGQIHASQHNHAGSLAQQNNTSGGTHTFISGKQITPASNHTFYCGPSRIQSFYAPQTQTSGISSQTIQDRELVQGLETYSAPGTKETTYDGAESAITPLGSGFALQRPGDNLNARSMHDPKFIQIVHSMEEPSIQGPSPYIKEEHPDDIQSVSSDTEITGSKTLASRSKAALLAINYLVIFFAQMKELRLLHKEALKKTERIRFVQSYRRIFKSYYCRLIQEATSDTEREVTRILRSRFNRESIAKGIANNLDWIGEESQTAFDELLEQSTEESYPEAWMGVSQDTVYEPALDSNDDHLDSSNSDDQADYDLQKIDRAKPFLQRGSAFRNLLLEIRLLILPSLLQEIVGTMPRASLKILLENDNSWVNRAKASLE